MKDARALIFVAALNLIEAILLVALAALFAMYLRAVTELIRLGGKVPTEGASTYFLFLQLKELVGSPAVFGLTILLAATLALSAMGIAFRRKWARLVTLWTILFRPFLLVELSWLFSQPSGQLVRIFGIAALAMLYAWIVWYLFQPEVKRAFGA